MNQFIEGNRNHWDAAAKAHPHSEFYDMEAFRQGKNSLKQVELDLLGDVTGKKILHLQCHFGQDTLSLARMGAIPTGVDFSGEAIKTGRELAQEMNLDARFVQANVLELDEVMNPAEEKFDLVFTSYGVIGWLPDLKPWARVIDAFLKPGGTFLIVEFHPMLHALEFENLTFDYPYFNQGAENPVHEIHDGTYASPDINQPLDEYFWGHSFSEIMMPLIGRGFQVDQFQEYNFSPYKYPPETELGEDGNYRYTKSQFEIPMIFALQMHRS